MRDEKQRRQFIFSTHNANIPVLGDDELIVGVSATGEAEEGHARINPDQIGSIDRESGRVLVEEILEVGVPRKIVRGMLEHNGTEPDLVEDDERFIVRLWAGHADRSSQPVVKVRTVERMGLARRIQGARRKRCGSSYPAPWRPQRDHVDVHLQRCATQAYCTVRRGAKSEYTTP